MGLSPADRLRLAAWAGGMGGGGGGGGANAPFNQPENYRIDDPNTQVPWAWIEGSSWVLSPEGTHQPATVNTQSAPPLPSDHQRNGRALQPAVLWPGRH